MIPEQTVDEFQEDVSQLATKGPADVEGILYGGSCLIWILEMMGDICWRFLLALTGDDNHATFGGKRQVLTGIENVIAQDLAGFLPK